MTSMHNGNVAVVGAAETTELGTLPGISMIELHADAARLRRLEGTAGS